MIRQNLLLVWTTASFVVAYSILAETSLGADSVAEVATQSRQLADAGKWDEARRALEDRLSQVKEVNQIARLKAELAHYAVERNTYFQKDDGLVRSKIEDARSAVQAADTQPALATLETAEGQVTYWNAREGTSEKIGVGDNNIVLIGTDDLVEIIPGTHANSVVIGSPADVSLIKRGIKLDGSITREPKCLI